MRRWFGCRVSVVLVVLLLAMTRPTAAQVMDNAVYAFVRFDELEYRYTNGENPVGWDALAWVGGDFSRLWLKSEGSLATVGGAGEGEIHALYGRLIAPYWDFQAGVRVDVRTGGGVNRVRSLVVLGVQGLAPYWFEVEPAVFVSQNGDLSARLTATYDLFVTQRLIAQPRIELNAAAQAVPDYDVGSGFNDLALGVRLRYGVRREYAPYLGVEWVRRFAGTARMAEAAGGNRAALAVVGGLRVWF